MSTQLHNDKTLFLRIANSDEQAFAILYRQFVPQLEPFIRSITKNEDLVTEAIQEAFTHLWMNRDRLAEVEYPKTYIYKMVSYICFQYLRRLAVKQRVEAAAQLTQQAGSNVENHIRLKELEAVLREGIAGLTPAQQRIYRLSREQGLTIPEIAQQLGISPNTVKNTLVTSLRAIRQHAEKAGYSLGMMVPWFFL